MPKININDKRGYDAIVPITKIEKIFSPESLKNRLLIPTGENNDGLARFIDLEGFYHVLAVGGAMSGLGMFRRVAVASALKYFGPEEVKLLLIDTLTVSLSCFEKYSKRLILPVAKNNKDGLKSLEWASDEVQRRMSIFKINGDRNIDEYNRNSRGSVMPKIIIMITEWGELLEENRNKTWELYHKIAPFVRWTGIHFIISTQRPIKMVLTDELLNYSTAKIAFQLPGITESRLVLGFAGAEQLVGQGDMIVKLSELSEGVECYLPQEKLQGYFLDEDEVDKYLKT